MPLVAIVTGLSGVGKTWLLKLIMDEVPGQFLSASHLISEEMNRQGIELAGHDQLRKMDIEANQNALAEGFRRSIDHDACLIVLDAHVAIDTPKGLTFIPSEIFAGINPSLFIFIEDDPAEIFRHRASDKSRKRPFRNVNTLSQQQTLTKDAASQIAAELGVPFHAIPAGDSRRLRDLLKIQNGTHHG